MNIVEYQQTKFLGHEIRSVTFDPTGHDAIGTAHVFQRGYYKYTCTDADEARKIIEQRAA